MAMYIQRKIEAKVRQAAEQFPVVAVLGPRQSGKSTLVKEVFNKHVYLSLENLDIRNFAKENPRDFLRAYSNEHGIILDEFQNAPEILSYIQTAVDESKVRGYFILTGSQNFLVNQAISQSLAGRVALFTLLPLALAEFSKESLRPSPIEQLIFKGSYPQLYSEKIDLSLWYSSYILTYLERDVRLLTNIQDLALFQRFLKLCAGRVGQLINYSSLAMDCEISVPTAKAWLSILQASYIVFLVQPHYKNFSKRLVQTPKLYFYDTGLACHLLELESEKQLYLHYLRGGLLESFIFSDLYKQTFNAGKRPSIYFWRDNHGHEVDCIIEKALKLFPLEIKASQSVSTSYFKGIEYWKALAKEAAGMGTVVYTGDKSFTIEKGMLISWLDFGNFMSGLDELN